MSQPGVGPSVSEKLNQEEILFSRLETLSDHSRNSELQYQQLALKDSISHLSARRATAWKRIISSISTTEAVEKILIEPLQQSFRSSPIISNYLEAHRGDEDRHSQYLARYAQVTFDHVKKKRTLSDRVIYDTLLPAVSGMFVKKPAFGFALILFFEIYGVHFYRQMKRQAEEDGLNDLARVLTLIQKDESRHFTGVETLMSLYFQKQGAPSRKEVIQIWALLGLLVVDVNMSVFGVHNRGVRKSVLDLGLDPDDLTRHAKDTVKQVCLKIRGGYAQV